MTTEPTTPVESLNRLRELGADLSDRQLAAALVNHLWRSGAVEDAHAQGRLHEEEMFVVSVTLTLAMEPFLAQSRWAEAGEALWAAADLSLPSRTRADLLGEFQDEARADLEDAVSALVLMDQTYGPGSGRARLVLDHLLYTHGHFGGPEYPQQVARFVEQHPDFAGDAHTLEHAPHTLPLPRLREALDAGLGYA